MTDALVELEHLSPSISDALKTRKLGDTLVKASTKVDMAGRHAKLLADLADAARLLGGLGDPLVRDRLRQAADKAAGIGRDMAEAATADDLAAINEDYGTVSNALRAADDALRVLWRQVAQNEFISLIGVGDLMVRIPGAADLGRDLAALGREAQALVERNASSDQLLGEVARLRERRRGLLDALHAFTGDDEVDQFLAGVTRGGATLSLVTPGVLLWLKGKGALDAFVIRAA